MKESTINSPFTQARRNLSLWSKQPREKQNLQNLSIWDLHIISFRWKVQPMEIWEQKVQSKEKALLNSTSRMKDKVKVELLTTADSN